MNLIEATQDMNKPDRLIRKGELHTSAAMLDDNDNLVDLQGAEYGLDKEDILADDWEIIRAEPEVLTTDEAWKKYNNNSAVFPDEFEKSEFYEIWNHSDQNGQIKEYKRLKPLIDALENTNKMFEYNTHKFAQAFSKVMKEFRNLTPPWEPEK